MTHGRARTAEERAGRERRGGTCPLSHARRDAQTSGAAKPARSTGLRLSSTVIVLLATYALLNSSPLLLPLVPLHPPTRLPLPPSLPPPPLLLLLSAVPSPRWTRHSAVRIPGRTNPTLPHRTLRRGSSDGPGRTARAPAPWAARPEQEAVADPCWGTA